MVFRQLVMRLMQMLLVVLGSITLVFFVSRVLPADPAVVLSGPDATMEMIEATRSRLGLDQPILNQYISYLQKLASGDPGRSAVTGHPVIYDLGARLPATLELVVVSVFIAVIISFIPAIFAARSPGSPIDRLTGGAAIVRTAVPTFFTGIILVWLFYTIFPIAPAPVGRLPIGMVPPPAVTHFYLVDSVIAGESEVFWAALKHLILPAITLSTSLFPPLVKVLRSSIRQSLESDSLLALRYTSIRRARLWKKYILPQAIVPTLTILAASFGSLVGGTVVVEHIFAWNGVGSYVLQGINNGDYDVVQGVVLISALAYAIAFFAVDIFSWWIDPRVLEGEQIAKNQPQT